MPKNRWAVLAGDALVEEKDLEAELAEEASLCLVYSNHPAGELFANEPMLKSPFTQELVTHVYNPGGGANLAGGNYPMMLADIKSAVLKATQGRQMPWSTIVPDDADTVRLNAGATCRRCDMWTTCGSCAVGVSRTRVATQVSASTCALRAKGNEHGLQSIFATEQGGKRCGIRAACTGVSTELQRNRSFVSSRRRFLREAKAALPQLRL